MIIDSVLKRIIKKGSLVVIDSSGKKYEYGKKEESSLTMILNSKLIDFKIFVRPRLYLGEAYMNGEISIKNGDIYDLLSVFQMNIEARPSHWVEKINNFFAYTVRTFNYFNTIGRSRKNVAHHYDISKELYNLFLDDDWQYSCGYFNSPEDSLEKAQSQKKSHIIKKLRLKENQKILDIGSGWGGLGIEIAKSYSADVLGITLSKEQRDFSNIRVKQSGSNLPVRFELKDYRDVNEEFDRIVSVGMFEHVGPIYYKTFFKKISDLLKNDGLALLHTIGRSDTPGSPNPWVNKYIFPGGYTPSLSEIMPAIESSGLRVTDIEVLTLHYAKTLKEWRKRFLNNRNKAKKIYDERFCKMWEFYLAACQSSFEYAGSVVFQIQLAKTNSPVPQTRDYIYK